MIERRCRDSSRLELRDRFEALDTVNHVDTIWDKTRDIIKKVGLKILGRRKPQNERKRRIWWTDECDRAVRERRKSRIIAEQGELWRVKYQEARCKCRRVLRQVK